MAEGVTEESLEEDRAPFYRVSPHRGRVVLILGGGNISSIPVMDVLTKLFNEGKVCVLKMSPINTAIINHRLTNTTYLRRTRVIMAVFEAHLPVALDLHLLRLPRRRRLRFSRPASINNPWGS